MRLMTGHYKSALLTCRQIWAEGMNEQEHHLSLPSLVAITTSMLRILSLAMMPCWAPSIAFVHLSLVVSEPGSLYMSNLPLHILRWHGTVSATSDVGQREHLHVHATRAVVISCQDSDMGYKKALLEGLGAPGRPCSQLCGVWR